MQKTKRHGENGDEKEMKTENEVNINSCSENQFLRMVEHGLKHGGVHLVSVKGHGKTRLLFNMAKELRQKSRVIILTVRKNGYTNSIGYRHSQSKRETS